LKKLLEHEVEEEENIILQCLRLILNNNYLQPKPMNPSIEVLGAEGEDGDVNDDYVISVAFLLFVWFVVFTYALLAGLHFTCRG
jgi:hypothetical protein